MSLLQTLYEVADLLRQSEIEFLIGGSLASSLWGQERTTHDADVAVMLDVEKLEYLDRIVAWPYVMDTASMRTSLSHPKEFASGQILHGETLDKIDLFLVTNTSYTLEQFARRRYVEVLPGKPLPFASPEDMIITKLRWFVLGNRISDRQWNDVVQVLEIQDGNLDRAYLLKWTAIFGIGDLLEAATLQVAHGY